MPEMEKLTVRIPDDYLLALSSSAVELGYVDRNGKPKLSTFIKVALMSNKIFKTNLLKD